jgi:NAD(P)-dependent dehydrogenase (short-subunit alcohol dehydrogenase family)
MFEDLRGKRALVTGAFGGLGSHFAKVLAEAGVRVALAGRRVEAGKRVADQIAREGGAACVLSMDVTSAGSVTDAFDAAESQLGGPVQIVVNSAGIAVTRPAAEFDAHDWQSVIDVNLNGAWRVAQTAGQRMIAHREGSIINIASILGLRVAQQVPAYAAAKAGLIQLTQALALEWARHGVRVNALAPGYIETDLNRDFFASDAGQALIRRVPQRRIGQPEHLDGALLLLASDAATFMTGSVLAIDGGHLVSSL